MNTSTTIIGGGIGGFTVARELRSLGYQGSIVIIDPEGIPYDRPPLSKDVLAGKKLVNDLKFMPESWYEEHSVEIIEDRVLRIDNEAKRLILEQGEPVAFENLVIASGGLARRGSAPGFADQAIVLRTGDDAQQLKDVLGPGKHLGIIGAGLIGAEVAAVAQQLGTQVTLIDPAEISLIPAVGEELARRLHGLHDEHGVTFIHGMTTGIVTKADGPHIQIDGHDDLAVDAVLLCIGIIPETAIAESAGLDIDGGVLVDHEQRTSAPGIWAVGDCARRRNPDGSLERRHEHWDSAVQEARAAAASINGSQLPVESASWFWSDRYGVHVEGTGDMTAAGTTYIREDSEGKPAVAFRVNSEGHLTGAASYNDAQAVRAARRIIDKQIQVDPEDLINPAIPLKRLAR